MSFYSSIPGELQPQQKLKFQNRRILIQNPTCAHSSFSFLTEWQSFFLPGASGAGSSCGGPGEGTRVITWHVNQLCMDTIRIHQIPVSRKQTGEVAIRAQLCVWSTYLVMAPRFLETPNWFPSDSPWVTCCRDTRGRRRRHDNKLDHAGHECGMKLIFLNWSQCLRCPGPCWELIRPLLVRIRTDSGDRCGTSSLWFISSPLWWIMWELSALDSRHLCLMEQPACVHILKRNISFEICFIPVNTHYKRPALDSVALDRIPTCHLKSKQDWRMTIWINYRGYFHEGFKQLGGLAAQLLCWW